MIVLSWIILSILVGVIGSNRNIGGISAFFISILLSPLIGLIIVLISKEKGTQKYEQSNNKQPSIPDEIERLKALRDSGEISSHEFEKAKDKLLN